MPEGYYKHLPIEKVQQRCFALETAVAELHTYRYGIIEEINEITTILRNFALSAEMLQQFHKELAQVTSKFTALLKDKAE